MKKQQPLLIKLTLESKKQPDVFKSQVVFCNVVASDSEATS
jgi:hypothetical protein